MGDFLNGCHKLVLTPDGKSAVNWGPYALQVENLLAGKEVHGLFCDDVLRNEGDGLKPENPGQDEEAWINAGIALGESRDSADFAAAVQILKFRKW